MATSYPGGIDAFTNPTATDAMDALAVPHADQHADANDAIEAIETELGTNPSGSEATVAARIAAVETTANAALPDPGGESDADILTYTTADGVHWAPNAGAGGGGDVAAGGTAGQVYTKQSGTDYDADWEDAGGGLTYITASSFSAVSSVTVNSCFTSTYDNYLLVTRITGSSNQGIRIRMRASGTDDTSANYGYQYHIVAVGSATAAQSTGQTSIRFGQVNTSPFQFTMSLSSPALAVPTGIDSQSFYIAAAVTHERWTGTHNVSTAYDGFTIFPDSGTITGSLRVYGLANS